MKRLLLLIYVFSLAPGLIAFGQTGENPYWHQDGALLDTQRLFHDERFPNVVVATEGTIIATWGRNSVRARRSEDGGNTWGPEITIADPGFQGGGTIVDENTGDILTFIEKSHPPGPFKMYRSKDHGKTWEPEEIKVYPDKKGRYPSMHMNEGGITLQYGEHAGRLIRPTRYYDGGNDQKYWDEHFTNAIYSDDGGKTWHTSTPFPAKGTGEAAIAELSDGTLYCNSRRHHSTDGRNPRMRHIAWSYDGGETWEDLSVSGVLPDGSQHRDYGLMGGLVRLRLDNQDILLFSNIESNEGRKNGTIWASFDGGRSWPVKRLIEDGSFAYSSLAAGREGTPSEGMIYLLYEHEDGANIARFNLNWVTRGRHWKNFIED